MVEKATMTAKDPADYILMPRTLTAENGAKALLSGEFTIQHTAICTACSFDESQDDCEVCAGEVEYTEIIPVDWSTIKAIYAKAVDGLAALPTAEPLLAKPAKVGAGLFSAGIPARLVIEAAQRQYEYEQNPPFSKEQIEGLRTALKPSAEQSGTVNVPVETLQRIHRDLDSCQKVIWLAGVRPRGYGFDPAYVSDAQSSLKEIEALLGKEVGQ